MVFGKRSYVNTCTHTHTDTHTQETNPQQRQQGPKFHFSTPVSEQERSIKCNYPENAAVTPCYTLTYEKHLNCIKNYDSNMDSVTVHIVFKVKLSFHDATWKQLLFYFSLGQRFPFNCFKSGKITTYKKFIMPRGLKSNRTLSPY